MTIASNPGRREAGVDGNRSGLDGLHDSIAFGGGWSVLVCGDVGEQGDAHGHTCGDGRLLETGRNA
jgi:hypothetical protein